MRPVAGYSGTPLPRKLGIKEGSLVAFMGAPADFVATLGELPAGVAPAADGEQVDVAVQFIISTSDLGDRFAALAARLQPAGGLWIAWPKRSSGVATDLTENVIREFGLSAGMVDNKVCAIDDTWSALRFVYRREDRPRVR